MSTPFAGNVEPGGDGATRDLSDFSHLPSKIEDCSQLGITPEILMNKFIESQTRWNEFKNNNLDNAPRRDHPQSQQQGQQPRPRSRSQPRTPPPAQWAPPRQQGNLGSHSADHHHPTAFVTNSDRERQNRYEDNDYAHHQTRDLGPADRDRRLRSGPDLACNSGLDSPPRLRDRDYYGRTFPARRAITPPQQLRRSIWDAEERCRQERRLEQEEQELWRRRQDDVRESLQDLERHLHAAVASERRARELMWEYRARPSRRSPPPRV